jgi:hypothetical protein
MNNVETEKANKDNVKDLLEELLTLFVNWPKRYPKQKDIIGRLIVDIQTKNITFIQLFKRLRMLMLSAKQKETIALMAKLFTIFKEHYQKYLV